MKTALPLFCLLILCVTATTMPTNNQQNLPKTRAELTNYEETTRYDEVLQFIRQLQKSTNILRLETFGKTVEGRELPLMVFSDPPVAHPLNAHKSGKAVLFVQANIHAGEVEGKEAVLHLSRRIAFGDMRYLLDKLIILIAPIYNADGNEKINVNNRSAQNGPIGGVGTRENAIGMDLNRDYMKLESPEANALINLFNRWDPHLIVDLHTTNGSYHGYHLTYAPTLNPNANVRLINFARNKMLPAINRSMLRAHKFRTYYYGNFATTERLNRELNTFEIQREGQAARPSDKAETRVWRTFDHRPRFGNNYCGLRNRLTILSEAYSYLDFKGRVAVTEAFVEEIFKYASLHADEIIALIKQADFESVTGKTKQSGVDFELKALDKPVNILVGEIEKLKNPISGKQMTAMIENRFSTISMPDYGLFAANKFSDVPAAYIFRNEAGLRMITEKLLAHGITVESLLEPLTAEVETYTISDVRQSAREFQGHSEVRLKGSFSKTTMEFPAGSILVRTSQPMSALIFYLLEAESDDGFVNWNFLDAYLEKGKRFPIQKLGKENKFASRIISQGEK